MTDIRPTIFEALNAVAAEVGAVRKGDRNQQQGFNFRGVDAVVNAIAPHLRKAGVLIVPTVEATEHTTVEVGRNRTLMGHCRVTVRYRWYGPTGDYIDSTVVAESMDAGDKAAPKAMSVAYRTAILQTLCLPTDEADPDAQAYQRSAAPESERAYDPSAIRKRTFALFDKAGIKSREDRLRFCAAVIGRDIDSSVELLPGDWPLIIKALEEGVNEPKQEQP